MECNLSDYDGFCYTHRARAASVDKCEIAMAQMIGPLPRSLEVLLGSLREGRHVLAPDFTLYTKKPNFVCYERAGNLLWDHMTSRQKAQWSTTRCISTVGNHSGDKYLIYICDHVQSFNVRRLGKMGTAFTCCAYARNVPFYDSILIQKLMIENDEKEFLRTANLFELRRTEFWNWVSQEHLHLFN